MVCGIIPVKDLRVRRVCKVQQFGLGILGGFLAYIVNVPQPVKQVGKILMNGMHNLVHDIGLLQAPKTG